MKAKRKGKEAVGNTRKSILKAAGRHTRRLRNTRAMNEEMETPEGEIYIWDSPK